MLAARRCSSSVRLAAACLGALALSGCASKSVSLLAPAPVAVTQQDTTAVPAALPARPAPGNDQQAMAALQPARTPEAGAAPAMNDAGHREVQAFKPPEELAWCRYLDARADAKNALLLSPTVSASIDNDQKASAKISYDFVDIMRAKLEKKSASAACARYYAADRITRMLFVTPQSLTYAGNLEKANYLQTKRGELTTLSKRISQHVENGEMTAQLAAGLVQYIETIRSEEYHARAEAHRRESMTLLNEGSVRDLDQQLTEAERTLQDVDRMTRSLEAISINLSAGVSRDSRDDDVLFSDDSAYAKLTVSYRLGAINPARGTYERMAEEARLEALREAGHGSLWYTGEMASALVRVREGLLVQRERLAAAIAEARSNAQKFAQGYEIEIYQSKYRAQVDVIKLTADLRGIDGTLADIDKLERKLRFR